MQKLTWMPVSYNVDIINNSMNKENTLYYILLYQTFVTKCWTIRMAELEKPFKQLTGDLASVNLQKQLHILIRRINTLKSSNNRGIEGNCSFWKFSLKKRTTESILTFSI